MQQNFKISRSMSEYLRCASKCAISRLNNQKFPSPHPLPAGTAEQNRYVRIPEICINMRHFKIENQKIFWGGSSPLGASPPSAPQCRPLQSCLRHARADAQKRISLKRVKIEEKLLWRGE